MKYRFMRTILFFDLPMKTSKDVRNYNKFLKYIKRQGFVMFQESVYTKLSLNQTVVDNTISNIKKNLPEKGLISVLTLTETQFNSITQLLGKTKSDVILNDKRLIEL